MLDNNDTQGMASFPLGGIDVDGRWEFARDNQSVREVVWGLLATRPGERLRMPGFGVGLHSYLHLPNTETTRSLIRENIEAAIRAYEPRIQIRELIVEADQASPEQINIRIHYQLLNQDTPEILRFSLNLKP
ncbi:MAG: GPW/gp25 family protein [Gammaproteobacteria bacterium]|jgi:uncharacterized protein